MILHLWKERGESFFMKFFKQTKETKRKISFFMALAMVISLLPVSPVVKAATNDTSNIYVTVDEKSSGYLEAKEVVTSGAVGAVSASVIIAPKNEFKFTNVATDSAIRTNTGYVKSGNALTLGSISIKAKNGEASTNASVVVREKKSSDNIISVKTGIVSPSSVGEDSLAEVSIEPTKNGDTITGAAVNIHHIKQNTDIEVAIVMENGEEVNPSSEIEVTFESTLEDATFKAVCGDKTVATSSGAIKIEENSKVNITIIPDGGREFTEAPKVNGEDAAVVEGATDGSYSSEVTVTKTNNKIAISGTATDKQVTEDGYTVSCSGEVTNAKIEFSLDGSTFNPKEKVKNNSKLEIKVTPDKGCYLSENGVKVNVSETATVTEILTDNVYTATVTSFTGNTTITISGEAKKPDVKDETNTEANTGGATLNTAEVEKLQAEIITALNNKVTIASQQAITKALKEGGTIGISLSVTGSSINKEEEKLGKDAITSSDTNAKNTAVALNITLTAICRDKDGNEVASATIDELTNEITITITATGIFGDGFKEEAEGYTRKYFVIRVHDGRTEKIECTYKDGKISFASKLFSTYVFYYEDTQNGSDTPGGNTPGGNTPGGNTPGGSYPIGGYVPNTSSTPAPSATPSATPSTTPSVSPTPGTTASAVPGDGSGSGVTPTKAPEATKTPGSTGNGDKDNDKNTGGTKTSVKVGKKVTVNSSKYKVTSVKSGSRAVQFTKGKKNAKSVVIPGTVKISGKNYKVTSIAKNAFKGNKKLKKVTIGANVNKIGKAAFKGCKNLKSIIVKTKKLTAKKTGANAFKGINKKATFKVPKKKVKAYKKIVKAKGAAKTVKVKK